MFAQVSIVSREEERGSDDPSHGAATWLSEPAVMTVVDGALKRVPIQTGLRDGDKIEVTGGLKEGDQVATDANLDPRRRPRRRRRAPSAPASACHSGPKAEESVPDVSGSFAEFTLERSEGLTMTGTSGLAPSEVSRLSPFAQVHLMDTWTPWTTFPGMKSFPSAPAVARRARSRRLARARSGSAPA
jgi:hypothetical protein